MSRYSQGICGDGAAILRDGQMMTVDEIVAALNQAELAKPAAVPDTCRQKLKKEGKPYPRSSCNFCGQLSPRWRDCDAMLYASPQPTAPAVSPVDVEAVRGTIFRMKDNHKLRESRCKPDPLISIWANELARAIGDEK